jgi:hypothetical protein
MRGFCYAIGFYLATICNLLSASSVVLEFNTGAPYLSSIATLPGTGVLIPYYDEDGFRAKPFGPIDTQAPYRLGLYGPKVDRIASNGSPHLALLSDSSLEIFRLDGQPFSPRSVSLAEYSTVFPFPKRIGFEGVFPNGSTVNTSFTTDGIVYGGTSLVDFQTFLFPPSFSGIVNLRATDVAFSLDDLVLASVPEPSSCLLFSAAICVIADRQRRWRIAYSSSQFYAPALTPLWSYLAPRAYSFYGAGTYSAAISDGSVFVTTYGLVSRLDGQTGNIIWQRPVVEASSPSILNGVIYVNTHENFVTNAPPRIFGFEADTGSKSLDITREGHGLDANRVTGIASSLLLANASAQYLSAWDTAGDHLWSS